MNLSSFGVNEHEYEYDERETDEIVRAEKCPSSTDIELTRVITECYFAVPCVCTSD